MLPKSQISPPAGSAGRKLLHLAVIFISVAICSAAARAQTTLPTSDFQIRNDVTIVFPVIKETDSKGKSFDRFAVFLTGVLRLGQNRLYPVDERIGGGFDLRINRFFTFSSGYLYRAAEPLRHRREYEHRIMFDLTAGNKWKNFSIKDRNRIEYRIRNSRPDSARYRNKFTFAFPVRREKKELFSPFFADEVFYDFHENHWSMNEFSAGFTRKLSKTATADIYYLRRDTRSGQIRSVNNLGISLKIHL